MTTTHKQLQPDDIDFVIYHHPCSDGTGAGYVAWKYLTHKFPTRQVTYYGAAAGSSPPDVAGKNVLICDLSYRKQKLLTMIKEAKNLLVIDHHKSAELDLQDIDPKYKIFDMSHSGATLTWNYFYPDAPCPLLLRYIEDRDIWTKKLDHTDEFVSWFYMLPLDFEVYKQYAEDDDLLMMGIKKKGFPYLELNNNYTNQAVTFTVPKFSRIEDKYYFVAYVNSSVLKSDIGNRIFDTFPNVDFTAVYSINDYNDTTSFSLRSTAKRADVSKIAFSLGGGGHEAASGVKVNYVTNKLGEVYDNGKLYQLLSNIYLKPFKLGDAILNVAYLNSTIYKKELASYLLQTKYSDVQVAAHLSNTTDKIHMAAIYDINLKTNTTEYTIVLDEKYKTDIINVLSKNYPQLTHNGNVVYISIKQAFIADLCCSHDITLSNPPREAAPQAH
jgi:uncharacterized protein